MIKRKVENITVPSFKQFVLRYFYCNSFTKSVFAKQNTLKICIATFEFYFLLAYIVCIDIHKISMFEKITRLGKNYFLINY